MFGNVYNKLGLLQMLHLITIVLLIFLISTLYTPPQHTHCDKKLCNYADTCDTFLGAIGEPIDPNNEFNSDSKRNDYYYDKTGMKGTMFRTQTNPIYDVKVEKDLILPESRIIKHLGIYPEEFYGNCESDFEQTDLPEPVYDNNPLNKRLQFNQGVLY